MSTCLHQNLVLVSQGKTHCNYHLAPENIYTYITVICMYVYLTVRRGEKGRFEWKLESLKWLGLKKKYPGKGQWKGDREKGRKGKGKAEMEGKRKPEIKQKGRGRRKRKWRKGKKKGKGKGKKKGRGRKEEGGWDMFNLHNLVDLMYSTESTDSVIGIL